MIPALPSKSVVSRFRPRFLEARQRGLNHFLKYAADLERVWMTSLIEFCSSCILLNPEFAASPILKDFIFS